MKPKIELPKTRDRRDGSFFSGSSWQDVGPFPSKVDYAEIMAKVIAGEPIKAKELEQAINYTAWEILHYAGSQWGNDYYEAVWALGILSLAVDRFDSLDKPGINPVADFLARTK